MSRVHAKTSSGKRLKISSRARELYDQRDKSLDNDPDAPVLPPEMWDNALVGKYYRPLKTQISFRVDNDVLDWLKSKGEGILPEVTPFFANAWKESSAAVPTAPERSARDFACPFSHLEESYPLPHGSASYSQRRAISLLQKIGFVSQNGRITDSHAPGFRSAKIAVSSPFGFVSQTRGTPSPSPVRSARSPSCKRSSLISFGKMRLSSPTAHNGHQAACALKLASDWLRLAK